MSYYWLFIGLIEMMNLHWNSVQFLGQIQEKWRQCTIRSFYDLTHLNHLAFMIAARRKYTWVQEGISAGKWLRDLSLQRVCCKHATHFLLSHLLMWLFSVIYKCNFSQNGGRKSINSIKHDSMNEQPCSLDIIPWYPCLSLHLRISISF